MVRQRFGGAGVGIYDRRTAPGRANGQPLTIALDMSGNLKGLADADGTSATLSDGAKTRLRYTGLAARDCGGCDVSEPFVMLLVIVKLASFPVRQPILQGAVNVPIW